MPNSPDPQNVYILQDFDLGSEVEAALKKAVVSVSETEVDTKLETKQDVLTPAQQAAVDSGITADKVTEIVNTVTEVQTIVIEQIPVGQDLLYGSNLNVTMNPNTYEITFQLVDQKGAALGSARTIDLPIESLVVNVEYDSENDRLVITLQNGTKTYIPVSSIVSGLQPAITPTNKLDADLVDDSESSNKFMTTAQANKLANAVNKVKMQDLENISGLVIENGTGDDKIITHSNAVTAVDSNTFSKITYDRHGHITGSTPVVANDITGLVSADNMKVTGYTKPAETGAIDADDTINEALGKLEAGLDSAGAVDSVTAANNSGLSVDPVTGAVVIDVAEGYQIPQTTDFTAWNAKMAGDRTVNGKAVADNPVLDGTDIELTGYDIADTYTAVEATDTVNEAIGKLEKGLESAISGGVTQLTADDHLAVSASTGAVTVSVADGYSIPLTSKQEEWDEKLDNTVTINSKAVADNPTFDGTDIALSSDYVPASAYVAINAGDTTEVAIGKLEAGVNSKVSVTVDRVIPKRLVFS